MHDILRHIPVGRSRAVTRDELRRMTGKSDRLNREAIEYVRKSGHPVINLQNGRGYYRPSPEPTAEELDDMERQLRANKRRALSVLKQQKPLKEALKHAGRQV